MSTIYCLTAQEIAISGTHIQICFSIRHLLWRFKKRSFSRRLKRSTLKLKYAAYLVVLRIHVSALGHQELDHIQVIVLCSTFQGGPALHSSTESCHLNCRVITALPRLFTAWDVKAAAPPRQDDHQQQHHHHTDQGTHITGSLCLVKLYCQLDTHHLISGEELQCLS